MPEPEQLWYETGGRGDVTYLMIHGRGATGAVWTGVRDIIAENEAGRWLIPDLPGHGGSPRRSHYSYGKMAADVADLAAGQGPLIVVGHSLGGVISLVLASGWFGLDIKGAVAFGIKVNWTEEELAAVASSTDRPVRWYDNEADAMDRYLRVSGLDGLVAGDTPYTARGICKEPEGYRFSLDSRAGGGTAPQMAQMIGAVTVPLVLATGGNDALAPIGDLLHYDADAVEMPGLVHNAQVQDPASIWALVEQLQEKN